MYSPVGPQKLLVLAVLTDSKYARPTEAYPLPHGLLTHYDPANKINACETSFGWRSNPSFPCFVLEHGLQKVFLLH